MERLINTESAHRWPVARFPTRGSRDDFLGQIRLWNLLEDLPRVEVEPLSDGYGIRYRAIDGQLRGLHRLIDSYGGQVLSASA